MNILTRTSLRLLAIPLLALAVLGAVAPCANAAPTLLVGPLSAGAENVAVYDLQSFLALDSSIYPRGIVSGYYGALTAQAVSRFQTRYGLTVTGTADQQTIDKMNQLIIAGGSPFDNRSPILSAITVSTTSNNAVITWNTDETATTKIYFSSTYPFVYAGAQSVFGTGGPTGHRATISSLSANTNYYFAVESVDSRGNVSWSIPMSLRTGM